jgi:hypothetical protein
MVSTVVEAVGGAMQDRDSFYYRAIRTKLGDAPRTHYDLDDPLPQTPTKALFELYEQERVAASGSENRGRVAATRTPHCQAAPAGWRRWIASARCPDRVSEINFSMEWAASLAPV